MTMGGTAREHLVPVAALRDLQDQIGRIARRHERAGADGMRLVDTGWRDGALAVVRLEGEPARLGEWEIVCVLDHRGTETRVEPCAPLAGSLLQRLAGARALCEACRTVRPRNQTFILRERPTGRMVQLGSSCLRPYTGAESAERELRRAEALAEATVTLAAAETSRPRRGREPGERYIDTTLFLAHAAGLVRRVGFHPADDPEPTWMAALELLERDTAPDSADLRRAGEIRSWASTLSPDPADGYRTRMFACLAHERLTSRELALAASAVRAYNRHLYWQIRRAKGEQRELAAVDGPERGPLR